MAIYSGHCFVAIVMLPVSMLLGVIMSELWPYAQHGISATALAIKGPVRLAWRSTVSLNAFWCRRACIIWSIRRSCIPNWAVRRRCAVRLTVARAISTSAEMACPDVKQLSSTVVWDARGISKMFGLPAAALAMYMTAKPERKAIAKAILIPAALTSLLVGVTEPIEFSFLFVAPLLFVVHAVLTGIGMMLFSLFGVHAIGANGIIDFILYNLPLGTEKSNWPMYIVVGLIMFALYFVVFRFLILRFNMKTPGREDEDQRHAFTASRSTRRRAITTGWANRSLWVWAVGKT